MQKLAVIGGGAMGRTLIEGWLARGINPCQIMAADPSSQQRQSLEELGILTYASNLKAVREAELIVLAVKPQVAPQVLAQISGSVSGKRLFSIVAGLTTETIEQYCPIPVIRAMPNNPCRVRAGVIAFAPGKYAQEAERNLAQDLFEAVGMVVEVEEEQLDAVTGLSGSAPAFIYLLAEALADGGVQAGLPRSIATQLAIGTLYGSAQTLRQTGLHPAILKEEVTSPAGTTIAGLAVLEERGVRGAMMEAVVKATKRARELGGEKGAKDR